MKPSTAAAILALCTLAAPAFAADNPGTRFRDIYTREWDWRRAQFAGADGEDSQGQPADRLPKVDPVAQAERERYWAGVLQQLDGVPLQALDDREKIDHAVFRAQVEALLARQRFHQWEMPFNSDSAFWTDLGFTARKPMRTADDYRRYLGQLRDIPRYFDEQIANMRAGLKRGFSVPRVTLNGRDAAIAEVVQAGIEDNLFYTPFRQMPATIASSEQAQLRAEAAETIRRSVQPAYAKLLGFMREEYLPQARTTLAAAAMPDGRAYYRAQIREYATLDLDADQIHRIGLEEVAKLQAQMVLTMGEAGFKGDFPQFLQKLRADPQFYARSGDELLMRAAWIAKRVDGRIGRYIGKLPRQRFAIDPVPSDLAPYYTSGRGGPDIYLVNTYNLPARPLYNLTALTRHESAPGHSLQMSLAAEQDDLPDFRRYTYISAYGEGWALYAEKLGVEMGLYDTPYDRFGMLTYQMWRACRLVIDTGIHHLGWTREQAQAYLRDRTALSEHEIVTEVDRYIAWPGQALSYYLGAMHIEQARAKAERALGTSFDLRDFHDAVLALGSVPLPVLEQRIDRYIAEQGKRRTSNAAPANAGNPATQNP